ncbi:MAG: redox-regulated ATPase YchF [Chitinispirillaceae bacterium]|nr:redox-regulated ATPase YchF [Chitinispirillaceae bacterium]
MGLTAGLIGLPNVGKSTIFNALTCGNAAVENYPFCTIEPNHGIAALPDGRLERIVCRVPTGRIVPAFLEMVDIAGLVRGASKGEGLGNQFLGHVKEVDALVMVVRCFDAGDVVHVNGSIDAVRDIEIIETELMLKDLETVERSLTRTAKAVMTGDKELVRKAALLERVLGGLQRGVPARQSIAGPEERTLIADLHLLTVKPVLYVANAGDGDRSAAELGRLEAVAAHAAHNGGIAVTISGRIESEIMQLPGEERAEYYASLGIAESGLAVLARSLYRLLNLRTFFTVNEKELHAWTILQGSSAVEAAAAVHTDFAHGFVRADVYCVEELEQYGSEAALRAAGKIRSEGREYVVNDGDIMFFKATP